MNLIQDQQDNIYKKINRITIFAYDFLLAFHFLLTFFLLAGKRTFCSVFRYQRLDSFDAGFSRG